MTGGDKLTFLYTNIGRGHPFYLDGIREELVRSGRVSLIRKETDVFSISRGISRYGWELARWLYRRGSSGGPAGRLYARLRSSNDYNRPGLLMRLMARNLRRNLMLSGGPLLVAHPSLVGMLSGRDNLYYQHGELVTPEESLVRGASTVFVPTEQVARQFVSAGYATGSVFVSGLCIEPALVRQAADAFELRVQRISQEETLVGACFSSGAEPLAHVEKIIVSSISMLSAGEHVVVFARKGGLLARGLGLQMERQQMALRVVGPALGIPVSLEGATLVTYNSRRELDALTAKLFPLLDYCIAPPHERSNWAVGLGLPMLVLMPTIGPFAPLNLDLLQASGVVRILDDETILSGPARLLRQMREDGSLLRMARAGWGKYPINGFSQIADVLWERHGASTDSSQE